MALGADAGDAERARRGWIDRPAVAVLAAGLLALAGAAAVGLCVQIRAPDVHDEFSYLLAADTFARGRLTNPPHPLWVHFESFHILQQPTYASKYPPGQGLALALGQTLTGRAIAGAWLSAALFCAAVAWMLLGWLPARWALLGGVLAALRFGIAGDWSQSYWGGAVAATGGALLLGALARLERDPHPRLALVMGLALALLANTRPYEGLVASLPVAAVLLAQLRRRTGAGRRGAAPVLLPLCAALAAAAVWMAYYDWRVTGDPLRLPYSVHEQTYASAPNFVFLPPRRELPAYRHDVMRDYWTSWVPAFHSGMRDPAQLPGYLAWKASDLWAFYLGLAWTAPLVLLPRALRHGWVRLCALQCLLVLAANFVTATRGLGHYTAPAAAALVAVVVACLREAAGLRWAGRRVGAALVAAVVLATAFGLLRAVREHPQPPDAWAQRRARLLTELRDDPERHLIFVRYRGSHSYHEEWVYNEAALDEADVVWAREVSRASDRALIDSYPGRRVWLLEVRPGAERRRPHPAAPPRRFFAAGAPSP